MLKFYADNLDFLLLDYLVSIVMSFLTGLINMLKEWRIIIIVALRGSDASDAEDEEGVDEEQGEVYAFCGQF